MMMIIICDVLSKYTSFYIVCWKSIDCKKAREAFSPLVMNSLRFVLDDSTDNAS
tara:strand:+ start:299 stop:460 length:162 start_codon:yes stop_codon:yes gene_type:complete